LTYINAMFSFLTELRTVKVLNDARTPFPAPWSVDELEACLVVKDGAGQKLAYVYFEDEPGRRIGGKIIGAGRGETDCVQYRETARAIEPPSDVGLAMMKTRCVTGYRARIMLWFSGKSKQLVVLNTQVFIDTTEYIPAHVSGDICCLRTAVRHALRTF
jgi:hypothetical protein